MINDDQILVKKVLNNDKAAFGLLYDRHSLKVFGLLCRLAQNRTLAEDLTQEVFVSAYRSLGNWKRLGKLSTWLCGIAVNTYRKSCANESRLILESIEDEALMVDAGRDPFEQLTQKEAEEKLQFAIKCLPLPYREVFILLKVEGMSQKEVARLLGIPIGTVQSRLWIATCQLRKQLAEDQAQGCNLLVAVWTDNTKT